MTFNMTRILRQFERAHEAYVGIGSQAPEDWIAIKGEYKRARNVLLEKLNAATNQEANQHPKATEAETTSTSVYRCHESEGITNFIW